MIPPSLLERIKSTPISEILGHYVALQNKGTNYAALCPFHDDKSPSLLVSDQKGIFKCFACDTGGDGIAFVQKYLNTSFPETLKEIAEKLHLPMDEFTPKSLNPQVKIALHLNQMATKIFRRQAQSGQHSAFEKFVSERKLSQEIVSQFSLGYAPKNNVITTYLLSLPEGKEREQAVRVAEKIGLIRPSKKTLGEYYDTFRERIIFPIWNPYDQVVGFGSRAVFDYQKGKYINSQESFIFNKRHILYGFNFAKASIRKKSQAILVEGYMDCLTLVQHNFLNTVAVMGVASHPATLKKVGEMARDILLSFDSDPAGLEAAKRAHHSFLQEGLLPRYLNYTPHKDPDEFLKKHSRIKLAEKIDQSQTLLDLLIEREIGDSVPKKTDQKLLKLNGIFELLKPLKESLVALERVAESAQKLNLLSSPEQIQQNYKDYLRQENQSPSKKTIRPPSPHQATPAPPTNGLGNPPPTKNPPTLSPTKSDHLIVKNFASHPECFQHPEYAKVLAYVSCNELKDLITLLKNVYFEVCEDQYPKMAQTLLSKQETYPSIMGSLVDGLWAYVPRKLDKTGTARLLKDLARKLEDIQLKEKVEHLKEQQRECATDEESDEYMKKITVIQRQRNKLKTLNKS